MLYDIIVDVGEFRDSDGLFPIMNLLSDLPHIYWDDVLGHARKLSGAKGEDKNKNIPVSIAGGYLTDVGSLQGMITRNFLISIGIRAKKKISNRAGQGGSKQ
jgi:hypothetical protein